MKTSLLKLANAAACTADTKLGTKTAKRNGDTRMYFDGELGLARFYTLILQTQDVTNGKPQRRKRNVAQSHLKAHRSTCRRC